MKKLSLNTGRGLRAGIVVFSCCALTAFAQEPDPSGIASALGGFAQGHPWVATALLIIGGLRVIFKPVMALLDTFVKDNCSPDEYARLRDFEAGPIYKWISFGLDLLGSIKLPVIGIKPAQQTETKN